MLLSLPVLCNHEAAAEPLGPLVNCMDSGVLLKLSARTRAIFEGPWCPCDRQQAQNAALTPVLAAQLFFAGIIVTETVCQHQGTL